MSAGPTLQGLLDRVATKFPERPAVTEPDVGTIDYQTLASLSDRLRDRLVHLGVRRGDRVGLYLKKSTDAIIGIFGVLKAGAAYVPVDPDAPPTRCAFILENCSVRVIIAEEGLVTGLRDALSGTTEPPTTIVLKESVGTTRIEAYLNEAQNSDPAPVASTVDSDPKDLAYILYTSGSTGKPKGVMLAQEAAMCFVDWCFQTFAPTEDDVFSSHAPLHFDLSIHDVFVPLGRGARLVLINEQLGKDPLRLAAVIAEEGISVWYSTPSILGLLATFGKLDRYDFSRLRIVLFAGEVFPIPQLRSIIALWPGPRYFNLYGPTETNVCTSFEVPRSIPHDRTEPFPIGRICPPLKGRVVDEIGADVATGEEGELIVNGPGVMSGYWNLPERNAQAFLSDDRGEKWYRTGDLVVEQVGEYIFHGRRDRMVKRRGYRIELGEIEAGLAAHRDVREVAVVAVPDRQAGVRINAFLSLNGEQKPSVIAFKQYSAERLPRYMVPDGFIFVDALPRTSTDKIDYQSLTARA